jgi:hypothetical protein
VVEEVVVVEIVFLALYAEVVVFHQRLEQ